MSIPSALQPGPSSPTLSSIQMLPMQQNPPSSRLDQLHAILSVFGSEDLLEIIMTSCQSNSIVESEIWARVSNHMNRRKLFVRSLNYASTSESLRSAFSVYGEVEEAAVIFDTYLQRSKGYGFVTFARAESADAALAQPFKEIDGRMTETILASRGKQLIQQGLVQSEFAGYHRERDHRDVHPSPSYHSHASHHPPHQSTSRVPAPSSYHSPSAMPSSTAFSRDYSNRQGAHAPSGLYPPASSSYSHIDRYQPQAMSSVALNGQSSAAGGSHPTYFAGHVSQRIPVGGSTSYPPVPASALQGHSSYPTVASSSLSSVPGASSDMNSLLSQQFGSNTLQSQSFAPDLSSFDMATLQSALGRIGLNSASVPSAPVTASSSSLSPAPAASSTSSS